MPTVEHSSPRSRAGSGSRRPRRTGTPPTPALLTAMLGQLLLIRAFEEYVLELAAEGLVHGPAHSSIGQEGGAVGSVLALRSDDTVNGSHRGHHQFLAKALAHVEPKGIDLDRPYCRRRARRAAAHARRDLRPGPGLQPRPRRLDAPAVEGGRRDRHQRDRRRRRAAGGRARPGRTGRPAPTPSRSPTSATAPSTSARRWRRFNLAAAWKLPLVLLRREQPATRCRPASRRPPASRGCRPAGPGFGIPSWKVDGMDPLAVHLAMPEAVEHMRAGRGPTLIEAEVYRYFHQNGPFPGSAFRYRTKEEEAAWRARDPIDQLAAHLVRRGTARPRTRSTPRVAAGQGADAPRSATVLLEPLPGGKPGQRRIRPSRVARPGLRRRRHPRRPAASSTARRSPTATTSPARLARDEVHRRRRRR